jgi:hypothetical protein
MKDSEFIQLLNLYLDHEISGADAARLETEVQRNPARHRIYRQYCQMHKACSLVAADFRTATLTVPEPALIDFKFTRRETRPARVAGLFGAGALAAAACVAVIAFSRQTSTPATAGTAAAPRVVQIDSATPDSVRATTETQVQRVYARAVNLPIHRAPASTTLAPHAYSLTGNGQSERLLSASGSMGTQFDWLHSVHLAPLPQSAPLEPLRFESHAAPLKTESRTYASPKDVQGDFQMAAFRFQR